MTYPRRILAVLTALTVGLSAITPSLAASSPAPVGGGETYTFERGDKLADIAEQFGVSVKAIVKANGLISSKRVIPGTVLTIPTTPDAISPAIAPSIHPTPADGKVIYISLNQQRMWAYDGDKLAFDFLVSTGLPTEANPYHDTKPGVYRIKTKMPEAYAGLWDLDMPYWMGIYDSGEVENGIHAMPSRNGRLVRWRVGSRGSFGCIVLNIPDGARLYRWAEFGTLVVIRR